MPPIITLTTDFGTRDPFVGVMKGVILGICSDARLVDLTHDVASQDVLEAALVIESSARFFPRGTVHLAVVDPGVGSRRRGLAISAAGQLFVGPDNGLFTAAFDEAGWEAVSLESPEYRLAEVSRTFHGRDVFAAAAGHLAAGVAFERFGPSVTDPARLAIPRCRLEEGAWIGEVIGADRFGNLLTSVTARQLDEAGAGWIVELGGRLLGPIVSCYADGREGEPSAVVGSSGRVEIFVRNASARTRLGAERGMPVRVRKI
jgi:S-adenosyl-L-methionine hydrolase (adenosine-forming)